MECGKSTFAIECAFDKMKEFEKKILAQNICGSFLPMSFVSVEQTERIIYDCSGYQSLENYEFANSAEMVEIIEKCVFALIHACEHLLNPRKFVLNLKTVFYSNIKKEVKVAYVPREMPEEKDLQVFVEFLESIEQTEDDETGRDNESSRYLNEMISFVKHQNRSLFDVINHLGEIKQEIHACG